MTSAVVSDFIRENYEIIDWKHANAILRGDFPSEWQDITSILEQFRLYKSAILAPGGAKSPIARWIDKQFYARQWTEKGFDTKVVIDGVDHETPTHKVDCFKNRVGVEIEWNNKDPFYDRDLNNFRLLYELRALSVGVIITRSSELQDIFDELGKGKSYGSSTTHMRRLIPRIEGGGSGGCPVMVFGIKKELYVED